MKECKKSNRDSLEKELNKIDEVFDRDIENFNLMEENNIEFLKSINLEGGPIERSEPTSIVPSERKSYEKVLDNQIILDSNPAIKEIENDDERFKKLINSKIIILSDKRITKIDNLQIYESLEELYLQRNFIKKIENLDYLKNLQILNLNNNYIRKLNDISFLKNLLILNLSDNLIENFDTKFFPDSLVYLYLFDNLFYDSFHILSFRSKCIKYFPDIIRIDSLDILENERFLLLGYSKKTNSLIEQKLKYIKEHYDYMKNERKKIVQEYTDSKESNNEESFYITTNLKNEKIFLIEKSKDRSKDIENSFSERIKEIKAKLDKVKNKFDNYSVDFEKDERMIKIKEKIRQGMKYDYKMQVVEKKLSENDIDVKDTSISERNNKKEESGEDSEEELKQTQQDVENSLISKSDSLFN